LIDIALLHESASKGAGAGKVPSRSMNGRIFGGARAGLGKPRGNFSGCNNARNPRRL
jgi:hypothetical protein